MAIINRALRDLERKLACAEFAALIRSVLVDDHGLREGVDFEIRLHEAAEAVEIVVLSMEAAGPIGRMIAAGIAESGNYG